MFIGVRGSLGFQTSIFVNNASLNELRTKGQIELRCYLTRIRKKNLSTNSPRLRTRRQCCDSEVGKCDAGTNTILWRVPRALEIAVQNCFSISYLNLYTSKDFFFLSFSLYTLSTWYLILFFVWIRKLLSTLLRASS